MEKHNQQQTFGLEKYKIRVIQVTLQYGNVSCLFWLGGKYQGLVGAYSGNSDLSVFSVSKCTFQTINKIKLMIFGYIIAEI